MIQLSAEIESAIEQQVAQGRVASPAEFVKEAVLRLLEAMSSERYEIASVVEAGMRAIDAGRYQTVVTPEESRALHDRRMERLGARLGTPA